ncbi:MAG TPA: ABC transporter permease [Xanthobacteraceae bacterium]|jgi:cell division transport system permease protein|nr:ABC transporter permease [Xanthobacteraceae bacterium]
MVDAARADVRQRRDVKTPVRARLAAPPRSETPIVPRNSIAGNALVAVVAIMTFLASLTTGAVTLVTASAAEWQADVAREVTIQVRPAAGRDLERDVQAAADIARRTSGISEVRPYSKAESARLLEPWLGTGLRFDDLPVPRLIVVRVASGQNPDFARLRTTLTGSIPSASLDDHRGWIGRMRAMAATTIAGGIAVLVLVLVATVLSVSFATRGAMATNRPIVEVLHFIGAKNIFVARQFQRHFLVLGLKGGLIGGGAALVLFALAGLIGTWLRGTATGDEIASLFGTFAIGPLGYVAIVLQIALIAFVTARTSRQVVSQTLQAID